MDWKFRQEMSARTYKDFVCLSERLSKIAKTMARSEQFLPQ